MNHPHRENEDLIRTACAAASQVSTGTPAIRVQLHEGGAVAYAAKIRTAGPHSPAFPGYVCVTVLERLGAAASTGECLIYVERRGVIERLSQWSLSQSSSELLVCSVGDDSADRAIEIVHDAIEEWRDGKHRLFDTDGYALSGDVAIHVETPKPRAAAVRKIIDLVAMLITIVYALTHLLHLRG